MVRDVIDISNSRFVAAIARHDRAAGVHAVDLEMVVHRRRPDGSWLWATDIFNSNASA